MPPGPSAGGGREDELEAALGFGFGNLEREIITRCV